MKMNVIALLLKTANEVEGIKVSKELVAISKLLTSGRDDKWSKESVHNGIKMQLIGTWEDLAGYYEGSDGNAWKFQTSWSNLGPVDEFKANFKNRYRGKLLKAFGFSSQEALDAYMKEHPDANKSNHFVEKKKNQKAIEKHVKDTLSKKHPEVNDLAKTPEDKHHVYNLHQQGEYAAHGVGSEKGLNHSLDHFKKQGPEQHQKAKNIFERSKKESGDMLKTFMKSSKTASDDKIQNQLILIGHHASDIMKAVTAIKTSDEEAYAEKEKAISGINDIIESVQELGKMLPSTMREDISEQISE